MIVSHVEFVSLMNLSQRYHRSKGGPGPQTGGTPLGNLTATCHREENASHQMTASWSPPKRFSARGQTSRWRAPSFFSGGQWGALGARPDWLEGGILLPVWETPVDPRYRRTKFIKWDKLDMVPHHFSCTFTWFLMWCPQVHGINLNTGTF